MRGLQVGAGAQRTTQTGWHRLAMVLACVLARTDSRTCKNSCVVSVTVDRECVSAVRCLFALENVLGASVRACAFESRKKLTCVPPTILAEPTGQGFARARSFLPRP